MGIAREADLRAAREILLQRGREGVKRVEFKALFGNDRKGRLIMAKLRASGKLPVVVTRRGHDEVYRIAQNRDEYRIYRSQLMKRVRSLLAVVQGLDAAWAQHSKEPPYQVSLFDSAEEGGRDE